MQICTLHNYLYVFIYDSSDNIFYISLGRMKTNGVKYYKTVHLFLCKIATKQYFQIYTCIILHRKCVSD